MTEFYITSNKYSVQERIMKDGKSSFDVVFRVVTLDGREKQKRLCGFKNRKEAGRGYIDFITKHCELISPDVASKKKTESISSAVHDYTMEEMFPIYLAAASGENKGSTVWDKKQLYDLYIKPTLGKEKLCDLTAERLFRWQDGILAMRKPDGEPYSQAYFVRIRNTLMTTLSYAENRFGIPNNLRKVKRPKKRVQKTEMKFWTKEQFEHFLSVIDDPQWRAFFGVLFYTGRRKGEVLALQYDDIKRDRISFTKTYSRKTHDGTPYTITNTKNEKKAATPICKPLQEILKEYEGQKPFFFGGENPFAENTVRYRFLGYCEQAGLEPIRIHDLRHSFASMLIHLGANMMVVADLIGDTVEQVMKTYGHLYEEDKLDIISKI
jgi:integrase